MSGDVPHKPCDAESYCHIMESCLSNRDNDPRRGLTVLVITDMDTGSSRASGVVFKRHGKDGGIVLNICPWCGTDYRLVGPHPLHGEDGQKNG